MKAFAIHVDTRRPALALDQSPAAGRPRARSAARSRTARRWRQLCAASASSCTPRAGAFALDPKLPDGRTKVRFVASDRAGNRSVITRTVAVDRTLRALHVDRVPALIGTAHPTLRGSLDDASPVAVKAQLDGTSVALRAPDGKACSATAPSADASRCR